MKSLTIIAIVLVFALGGLVVFARMMNQHGSSDDRKEASVNSGYKYNKPDERYFKTDCYKADIFPSDCKYELITLKNDSAIMLDVVLDENKFTSCKAYPLIEQAGIAGCPSHASVMDYYRFLKANDIKMYLYRLTYLNKKTGEEKDIAYFCGPIQGGSEKTGSDMSDTEKEYSYNKEWPHKLVIYDAFVKEDLSELKLLAGQHFDVSVIVFKLSDILQKPGKKEFYEIEYGKDYFKSSVSATGIGINEFCFLTPSVVSVSIRLIDRFGDKTYKYHVMPTIMEPNPKTGEHLYQKIMWCNNSCDYYTFDGLLFIYGFRKDGVSQKWPSNEEIDAFRKRKGFIGEPKYDMNEWDGWTRMNRDSSWLKD